MKKFLKIGCLSVIGLGVLLVAGLLFLAWNAKPLPGTAEALATVPESERAALQQITKLAGIESTSLRHIGGYGGTLFDDARNRNSLVIREGHIVALCMRGAAFASLPDPGGLTALEALDWSESSLTQWPDLSKLSELRQLNLSTQPLPDAAVGQLPLKLEFLRLAGTKITDTTPFSHLDALTELDLSGTAVTSFEPLLGLRLKLLNLANSKVNALPATVPKEGEWTVDLDGTPLLNPPGYAAEWPFDGWITATASGDDAVSGTLNKAQVDVRGTAAPTAKARAIALPRVTDPGVPPVTITLTCAAGRARVWMEEPPDLFPSPWMKQRKVKGFGVFRSGGYVFAEVSPDKPAKLHGRLHLTTQSRIYEMPSGQRSEAAKPPDWCDYSFYLEPLDGSTVTGAAFAITASPR